MILYKILCFFVYKNGILIGYLTIGTLRKWGNIVVQLYILLAYLS
jgi:hypothetical protein